MNVDSMRTPWPKSTFRPKTTEQRLDEAIKNAEDLVTELRRIKNSLPYAPTTACG